MKEKYRIVTEDGKEILRTETYAGCESYWNACNGIYEDESGEHYLSMSSIWTYNISSKLLAEYTGKDIEKELEILRGGKENG